MMRLWLGVIRIKLSWENFKGEPKTDTDAVAVTASGITFSYSMSRSESRIVDFSATVEAHFLSR